MLNLSLSMPPFFISLGELKEASGKQEIWHTLLVAIGDPDVDKKLFF